MEAKKELAQIQKQSIDIVNRAENFQLTSEAKYEDATKVISWIANAVKRIEALRKFHTKPLNDQLKRENDLHRSYAKPFKDAREIMDNKMLIWNRKKQVKIDAENERVRKEAEKIAKKEDIPVEEVIQSVEKKEVPKTVGTATIKKRWVGEVINEDEVERQYCSSDSVKINAGVKQGIRKMKGVRIYEKEGIATK